MKRTLIIASLLVELLLTTTVFAQTRKPLIRFGLISDIQYCDCATSGSRFYRNSLKKLHHCVADLNQKKVAFTLNLGDIVDRDAEKSLDTILHILDNLKKPLYNLPGNHDYSVVKDNDWLYKKLGMPGPYYSFTKKKWRFIMLNTNEVSSYAKIDENGKAELAEMLDKIKSTQGKNGAPYNGGVGKKQLEWLENELKEAERKKESVLIFSHHPFGCEENLTALDAKAIVSLLAQYKSVKAVIAGHHHAGGYCEINKTPFIITEGMVETADSNAYGVVEIYKDRIVLTGTGRTRSHEIKF